MNPSMKSSLLCPLYAILGAVIVLLPIFAAEEADTSESVENYSHLKNKWVIFCGIGVAAIDMHHPEFRTVILFDHQPTAKELLDKLKEMMGEKSIVEICHGVQTSEPYAFLISTDKQILLGGIDRERKFNLKIPQDFKIPNFCEVSVGFNEIGIAKAAARLLQQEAEQDGTGQPATRPESKSEEGDKPKPEAQERSR